MRLLFVVQRYGNEVFGGAEHFARSFATRLAERNHEVHVVTSCAVNYMDWADHYPPGDSHSDGVQIHRLSVRRPRNNELFNALNVRVNAGERPVPLYLQRAWMELQGPRIDELPGWLAQHAPNFDVAVFFTYLYWSTWAGLPAAAPWVRTVLHPTAHDEPPLYLSIYDLMFRLPDGLGFLTPEEAELVGRRFRVRPPSVTTGVGLDLDVREDSAAFRRRFGLGDSPYLVFVGRVDPHKGSEELFEFFTAYKRRRPGPLKLVIVGEQILPLPPHVDVVTTGWVDDATKHASMAGALALVQPSYFESFSIVLTEAWTHRRPALVQGNCAVLAGQARRSGGAIPYCGFGEFEAAVELLSTEPRLGQRLGNAGRKYVEAQYGWPTVLSRYENFLASVKR